jgi:hypothetical protein
MPAFYTTRTIGIEMETTMRHDALVNFQRGLTQAFGSSRVNQQTPNYYHSNGRTWDVKTDSSCGGEIASPAIRLDATGHNSELKTVCELLGASGAAVTAQCGLHVHVDVSDFTRVQQQRLLSLWLRYEPFFFSMIPRSRRNNHYCAATRSTDFFSNTNTAFQYERDAMSRALRANSDSGFRRGVQNWSTHRTSALNITGLWMSGRVEFRLHSGTINYEKIRRWALWLLAMVERAKGEDVRRSVASPLTRPTAAAGSRLAGGPQYRATHGVSSSTVARAFNVTPAENGAIYTEMLVWANERRARFAAPVARGASAQTGAEVEAGE